MATAASVNSKKIGREIEEIDYDSDEPHVLSEERMGVLGARRTPQMPEHMSNRIVVGINITVDQFTRMVPDNSRLSWGDGLVILEEYPLFGPHGYLVTELHRQTAAIPSIEGGADMSYSTVNWIMQPDASYVPTGTPNPGPGNAAAATPGGLPWPSLLVEVLYKLTLGDMRYKFARWMGAATLVQIGICFKIYSRVGGTIPMVAVRYERGAANPGMGTLYNFILFFVVFIWYSLLCELCTRPPRQQSVNSLNGMNGAPVVGVGAGGAPCNAPGLPMYQLRIPSGLLFNGVALPVGAPQFYTIDLFAIQQVIIRRYE